jgi:hypothetical protein
MDRLSYTPIRLLYNKDDNVLQLLKRQVATIRKWWATKVFATLE